MKVFRLVRLLPTLLLFPQIAAAASPPIHLADCIVSMKEQVLVPARQAGVLVSISVQEGSRIEAGQALGQIDDSQQQLEHELARVQQQETAEKANSDIDVRYAQAAEEVSLAELASARNVNQRVGGSLPASEIRRLELAARKAKLLVERAEDEKRVVAHTLRGRDVAVSLAQQRVARCRVASSISGEIIEIHKQPGEWANPGEPIAHVARLDTLRVEGFVAAADHEPVELAGQPVVATVQLAHGRKAEFTGQIVYVRPVVQGGGQFLVYAEVTNRMRDGHWLLRPGMLADMTIGEQRTTEARPRPLR